MNVGSDYQERYTFDSFFRQSSAIRTIGTRTYTTNYQLNQASQPRQVAHMYFDYDSSGRLSAIKDSAGTAAFTNAAYNITGQLTGDSLHSSGLNGTTPVSSRTDETFGFDANRLQLTTQTATTVNTNLVQCEPSCPPPPPGGTNLSLTYNYQASAGQMGAGSTAGNAGQLMSVSGTIGGVSESASYQYDLLGRLRTSVQTSNGTSANRMFAYDRWGNRTTVWNNLFGGTPIQTIALEQAGGAPTNRIASVTEASTVNYSYDAVGNVTNDGAHSYAYDSQNRLVSVDGGSTGQYGYDHQNRRYKKTIGSTVTHYVWEGGKVLGEYNGSTGALEVSYWYAGERLFKKSGATTQVLLSDRLSIRLSLSSIGVIAGRQGHLPFGEDFAESGSQDKHHFTSYERDNETGSDYAVNRQYSQSIARFNRTDPLASSAKKDYPQTWNRYSYAGNEPVSMVDPSGLDTDWGSRDPFAPPPMKQSVVLFPWEMDPCSPKGATFLLDGADMFSSMMCTRPLRSPGGFSIERPPGTLSCSGGCANMAYMPEGGNSSNLSDWVENAAPLASVDADFVATPRGVVKIPDGCSCQLSCGANESYRIDCSCLVPRNFLFFNIYAPDIMGQANWGKDLTNPGSRFAWIGSEAAYTRHHEGWQTTTPVPVAGGVPYPIGDSWSFR